MVKTEKQSQGQLSRMDKAWFILWVDGWFSRTLSGCLNFYFFTFLFSLFLCLSGAVSGLGSHPNTLLSTWMGRTHPVSVHLDQVHMKQQMSLPNVLMLPKGGEISPPTSALLAL